MNNEKADNEVTIAAKSVDDAADKAKVICSKYLSNVVGGMRTFSRNVCCFAKAFIPSRISFVLVQARGDGCYTCRIASSISVFWHSKFVDAAPNALINIAFGEMHKEDIRIVRNGVSQFDLIDNGTGEVLCSAVAC